MNFKQALSISLLSLAVLSASGCGSRESLKATKIDAVAAQSVDPGNSPRGDCGSQVVSDHMAIENNKGGVSLQECRNCRASLQSFIAKYPSISCSGSVRSKTSIESETFKVQASDLNKKIEGLTGAGC